MIGYVYKITNDINNKLYIGKTMLSLKKRFDQHCRDSMKRQYEKRPQYSAMRKYGKEHFSIHLIEECDISEINNRETYWIKYYGTYEYGYNATKGGDGKFRCDYDLVVSQFQQGKNCREIAKITGYDPKWCSKILKMNGCTEEDIKAGAKLGQSKPVVQIDLKTHEVIREYESQNEAAEFFGSRKRSFYIGYVCRGKAKSAFGYFWRYKEDLISWLDNQDQ